MNMKNQTKHPLVFAVLAIVFLAAAYSDVAAQTAIQFDVLYECPRFPHNFKVLSCPSEKFCEALGVNKYTPSASYKFEIYRSSIIEVFEQGGCKVDGKPLVWGNNTTPPNNNPPNDLPQTPGNKPAQTGRFKVGDRVLASPAAMIEDDWFEKCTVIKDMMIAEGADSYRVLCDDPKGGIGRESYVKVPFIKARANAEPPPAAPECQFNEPAGTVSKTAKPSAGLFKRVLFERYRDMANGLKTGITFETFQLGKSYVNRLTGKGLMHDGAPQGATINSVKTKFILCVRHTDSTLRTVYEAQYNCFKDNFGDWICPNSALKLSESVRLPIFASGNYFEPLFLILSHVLSESDFQESKMKKLLNQTLMSPPLLGFAFEITECDSV